MAARSPALSRPRAPWAGALACLLGLVAGAASLISEGAPASAPSPEHLQISIEYPGSGQRVGEVDGLGLLSGRVLAYEGRLDLYEMIFAIDVSGSTADPSGIDVDGDGKARGTSGTVRRLFGSKNSAAADNILSAELAAVRALLEKLDARTTRVGVVVFSGDEQQGTPDALVEVPLTSDYARVRKGLEEIALVPPQGATNMGAGLRTALAQLKGKRAEGQSEPQRFVVFLTDGQPMLPYMSTTQAGNDALEVARQAAKREVRILSFAVGRDAADSPRFVSEMARITRGRFVAVRDLNTLSTDVASVTFTNLASLTLRNRTLDAGPSCQIVTPEGRFAALVPIKPGKNSLEVRARSTAETEEVAEVSVELAPGASLEAALDEGQRKELLRLRTLCERPAAQRNIEIKTDE
jgi:uncharacterized protein YegL